MARKKQSKRPTDESAGFGGSFGDLLRAQGMAPAAAPEGAARPEANRAPEAAQAAPPERAKGHGKIVLRREKKGRRGKVVTRVEGWREEDVEDFARRVARALGCGVSVEGGHLIVQGDQTSRLKNLLVTEGVSTIVTG